MTTKLRKILLLGGIALLIIIGICSFFLIRRTQGVNKAKNLIDQYMTAFSNMDAETIAALSNIATSTDATANEDSASSEYENLASEFALLESYGATWKIDYEIENISKGGKSYKEKIKETIYDGDASVKRCYIATVNYTVTVTLDSETKVSENEITFVCYKIDGNWYLAGLE